MTIWFTADWHLGHERIIDYTGRPFRNAHEMNAALLDSALAVVRPTDTLYVLGDFAFDRTIWDAYAAALSWHCRAIFIKGNHDAKQADHDGLAAEFKHNKHHYYVCHYPWATWRPNTVMLHGHTHGNPVPLPDDQRQQWRYDVGVDTDWSRWPGEQAWRPYSPVSIEQVESRMRGD